MALIFNPYFTSIQLQGQYFLAGRGLILQRGSKQTWCSAEFELLLRWQESAICRGVFPSAPPQLDPCNEALRVPGLSDGRVLGWWAMLWGSQASCSLCRYIFKLRSSLLQGVVRGDGSEKGIRWRHGGKDQAVLVDTIVWMDVLQPISAGKAYGEGEIAREILPCYLHAFAEHETPCQTPS